MEDKEFLKIKTLRDKNIEFSNNFFRYINHDDRLATTGFKTRSGLEKWSNEIRFDLRTIETMQKRYSLIFS